LSGREERAKRKPLKKETCRGEKKVNRDKRTRSSGKKKNVTEKGFTTPKDREKLQSKTRPRTGEGESGPDRKIGKSKARR